MNLKLCAHKRLKKDFYMNLYPLKFKTIFKDKIWGGNKINTILGKEFSPLPNCGETWEISGVSDNISIVSEGESKGESLTDLIKKHKGDLIGESVYSTFGDEFPLLIKFIDAKQDLSIQVHPNDEIAKTRHNSFGKTEMWYIFEADKGASLISGFNQQVDKEIYQEKFKSGNLTDILSREEVKAGDVFFIPAGRVHTIGAGVLLAEIQQTSDITYRIYDFDRKDDNGQLRDLHTEEALEVINYEHLDTYKTPYKTKKNNISPILDCKYFETNKYLIDKTFERNYSKIDSFRILICYRGQSTIKANDHIVEMNMGDTVLIPANLSSISITPKGEAEFLETYIPKQ